MKPDTVLLGFRDDAPPRDFFRDPTSPYKTDIFDLENGVVVFPVRKLSDPRLSATEYVQIVSDVLCVNKNVCLCRHFHNLDMAAVERRSPALQYIDVWVAELLAPSREAPFTVRGLFALQLAAVVRSARGWQHLRLRVFSVAAPPAHTAIHEAGRTVTVLESSIDPSIAALAAGRPADVRLEELLKLLRINATTHTVTDWPSLDLGRWTEESDGDNIYQRVPIIYLQTVNSIIRDRSREGTAVTFVQLPTPPKLSNAHPDQALCEQYLKVLDEFTKDLPPTILVRGLKSVTSTSL